MIMLLLSKLLLSCCPFLLKSEGLQPQIVTARDTVLSEENVHLVIDKWTYSSYSLVYPFPFALLSFYIKVYVSVHLLNESTANLLLHITEGYKYMYTIYAKPSKCSPRVRSRTMFPRSSLVRLPWFEKQQIHMVLRDSFQVMFLLRGPNPQGKFLSFRATPEVNFSALSPVHNVLPSRCPSPNKSARRDIIVVRVYFLKRKNRPTTRVVPHPTLISLLSAYFYKPLNYF